MSGRYHFVTAIELTSTAANVQRALEDVSGWPSWWRWATRIHQTNGLPPGAVGAKYRNQVRTPMGYGFNYEIEIVDAADGRIRLESTGDLEGAGLFIYEETSAGGVHLEFVWLVRTTKWWMNTFGPIARPVFGWNHNRVMTDFAEGLATASDGRLLEVTNTAVAPGEPGFFALPG